MKAVQEILEFLGYREIRPETTAPEGGAPEGPPGSDWRPIEAANGRYGTTDETHVITQKRKPTCRLVDAGTGELVATARKSCPLDATE